MFLAPERWLRFNRASLDCWGNLIVSCCVSLRWERLVLVRVVQPISGGGNYWIVPNVLAPTLSSLAQNEGRIIRALEFWQPSNDADSIMFFGPREMMTSSRLAEWGALIAVPWGVLTLPEVQEPVAWIQNHLPSEKHCSRTLLAVLTEEGTVLVDDGKGIQSWPLESVDLPSLLTQRQWDICVLNGHGEAGHLRVGSLVICAAPLEGECCNGGCCPPSRCRRAGKYNPFWFGNLNAKVLVTFTCGGWSIGGEILPTNLSTVARVESSTTVAWVTTCGSSRVCSEVIRGTVDLIRGGFSLGGVVMVLNDLHERRWGFRPYVLWGDPSSTQVVPSIVICQETRWFATDPLLHVPIIGRCNDRGSVLRGVKGLMLTGGCDNYDLADYTSQFKQLSASLEGARRVCARVRRYLSSPFWPRSSEGSPGHELWKTLVVVEQLVDRIERVVKTIPNVGVLSKVAEKHSLTLANAIDCIDELLAMSIAFELHSIDLLEVM